jgi:Peptidase M30.
MVLAVACGGGGGDGGTGVVKKLSDISTMTVGEVRVLNPTDIPNGIDLPAGSGARDYIIVVGNTSNAHDVPANFVVKADKSATGAFSLEAASDLAAQSSLQLNQVPVARTPQEVFENRVRSFERTKLSLHSRPGALYGASRLSPRRSAQVSQLAVPAVGDVINIKIPNASTTDLCTNFIPTQAVVASVSQKAILAVDTLDGPPLTLFNQAQMDSITSEFDAVTYPTDAAYFNTPTDFDGNGHIIMLFTGQINKLTPPGTTGGFVGGFFFAGDFFPTVDTQQAQGCAQSNEAEIFYLLSPDPTGRFGNTRSTGSVRQGTRGTIAHEFQHMINAGNRFTNPLVSNFESTWLDEALAHFAEDAVGRVQRGFTDLQTLTFNDVLPCNTPCAQANDFNAFFFQNLARLTDWMDHPDQFSPISDMADTSLAVRGAAWAIVRYGADNFSAGLPRAFTHALSVGPDTGVTNFTAATKAPLDSVVKGWLVSMYADHLAIAGLDAKYQYRSYNFRSVMPPVAKSVLSQNVATYPLRIQSIGSGSDNISAKNLSGTGSYFRLTVAAGAAAKNVKILDQAGANAASFSGEHVYVLRVQ